MANDFLFSERELEDDEDGNKQANEDNEDDKDEDDDEEGDEQDESEGDQDAATGQGQAGGDLVQETEKVGDLMDGDDEPEPDSFGLEGGDHGAANPDSGQKYEYNSEDSVDTRHQRILEAPSEEESEGTKAANDEKEAHQRRLETKR